MLSHINVTKAVRTLVDLGDARLHALDERGADPSSDRNDENRSEARKYFLLRVSSLTYARLRMNSKKRTNIRSSPRASNKIDVFFCRSASQYCLRTEFARLMLRTLVEKNRKTIARSE